MCRMCCRRCESAGSRPWGTDTRLLSAGNDLVVDDGRQSARSCHSHRRPLWSDVLRRREPAAGDMEWEGARRPWHARSSSARRSEGLTSTTVRNGPSAAFRAQTLLVRWSADPHQIPGAGRDPRRPGIFSSRCCQPGAVRAVLHCAPCVPQPSFLPTFGSRTARRLERRSRRQGRRRRPQEPPAAPAVFCCRGVANRKTLP